MSPAKPWCARCQHEVDAAQLDHDASHRETVYRMRCHGQRETLRISDIQVAGLPDLPESWVPVAFVVADDPRVN